MPLMGRVSFWDGFKNKLATVVSFTIVNIISFILAIIIILALLVMLVLGVAETYKGVLPFIVSIIVIILIVAVPLSIFIYIYGKDGIKMLKLANFAQANNFTFLAKKEGNEDGIFQGVGTSEGYSNHLKGEYRGKSISLSDYSYTVQKGRSYVTYNIGVIDILLPTALPNILLDSKKNNFFGMHITNMANSGQKLSLEGNFDSYFTLYTPDNYERDTLYFLTPELMQLLISEGQDYDLEIIDNKLKLYRARGIDNTAAGMRSLFAIIDSLGGEFIENTSRYKDERSIQAGLVAQPGQKLRKRTVVSIVGSIIFITWLILYVYSLINA